MSVGSGTFLPFQEGFPVFPSIDSAATTATTATNGSWFALSFLRFFPIMHIVDLGCFLHSVNMSLGGNFPIELFP